MAMTLVNQYTSHNTHEYVFTIASSGTSETCQLPAGKRCIGVAIVVTSATGRAPTTQYTQSTGVLTIGGLTAADALNVTARTD